MTTRRFRNRCSPALLDEVRPPFLSDAFPLGRVICNAGATPKIIAVKIESVTVKTELGRLLRAASQSEGARAA